MNSSYQFRFYYFTNIYAETILFYKNILEIEEISSWDRGDVYKRQQRWRTIRTVTNGNGGVDALLLPDSETRYVRLAMHRGQVGLYRIREIIIKPVEFGETSNAFFSALAKDDRCV